MPVKKKATKKGKGKNEENKQSFKQKFAEMLELPKEVVLNVPKFTLFGNNNLIIENYKGIVEYENNRIRINTAIGTIRISGDRLIIKEITSEDIMVDGEIMSFEFLK